jgi:hypothetical protein
VTRECFEVTRIRSQHGSAGLRGCDDERIDRGASASQATKQRGPTSQRLRNSLDNVAALEQAIFVGVVTRVPLQTLHELGARYYRRPEALIAKPLDERQGALRTLCEARDATGIENESH